MTDESRKDILRLLGEIAPTSQKLALDLWKNPELGLEERYAADRYEEILSLEGFQVQRGIGDLDTAISASWGSGSPCIGFLGEYDALPGIAEDGGLGHGCGHNLLGAASLGSAMALKRYMERLNLSGTVVFYGCPAEENNGGKVYMARDGCFSELDAALTWHPSDVNAVWEAGTLALNACNFVFKGVTSHAAKSPETGRSALDGAILMDVGVNYLREHMIQEARIHSVITSGGKTPNVVPAEATICYYVRAPRRDQVEPLFERVVNCAKGAALMTDTTFEIDMIDGLYDYLSNPVLNEVASKIMSELGGPSFDEVDRENAAKLQSSLSEKTVKEAFKRYGTTADFLGQELSDVYLPGGGPMAKGKTMAGSTDVGDVSHIVPTLQITTCAMPIGTSLHSWQSNESFGSTVGLKGMNFASEVLTLTALELLKDASLLKKAKDAFDRDTEGEPYESPLIPGARPKIR